MKLRTAAAIFVSVASAVSGQTRFVVRTTPAAVNAVASSNGLTVLGNLDGAARQVYVMSAPAGVPGESVLASLRSNSAVLNAEADSRVVLRQARLNQSSVAILDSSSATAPEPILSQYRTQPATSIINLASAQRMATGAGIVAVIDTGIDARHSAFEGTVVPGYDFTRDAPGYASDVADLDQSTVAILDESRVATLDQSTVAILDQAATLNQSTVAILDQSTVAILDGANIPATFGHGTMVAGLIHLVAPSAKLMPLKVFSADGTGYLSDIVRAIYYAANNGAQVINMSFSMDGRSQELTNALNWANANRAVMVASVANAASPDPVYPAASGKVLGIASTDDYDIRSFFSSYGADVALAAPGERLITTFPFGRFAMGWGTSFATPLVSGTASLLVQLNPNINQAQASPALLTAAPLAGQDLGAGRLDTSAACTFISSK